MTREMISVIALFDDESNEIIKSYQNPIITDTSKRNDTPHLTLAVYDRLIDIHELTEWVDYYCSTHHQLSITLGAIGIFNKSNIFALPGLSKDLYQYYMDFHEKYNDRCREYFSPRSKEWFPHIGLLYTRVENAKDKFSKLMDIFQECTLTIKSIRITKRTEDGFVTIDEIELCKK